MKNTNDFVKMENLQGYLINESGEVFSEKSGKFLKTSNGIVEVYVDGCKKKLNVARMVLETFSENPQNASRVRYKNGDKNDSSLGNIEWIIPTKTKKTNSGSCSKTTSPRQKEIANEMRKLQKQIKMLQREKEMLTQSNGMVATIKDNMLPLVEGLVKGENILKLTKRLLGKVLSRNELSQHLKEQCSVSLNEIVDIAKLYRRRPDFIEAIIRLKKGKLGNVVFSNVK